MRISDWSSDVCSSDLKEVFLADLYHGIADGGVAVGVVFHGIADHVGGLVEPAIVHLLQRMQDAPLYGLESIVDMGYGPVKDDVGGVIRSEERRVGKECVITCRSMLSTIP